MTIGSDYMDIEDIAEKYVEKKRQVIYKSKKIKCNKYGTVDSIEHCSYCGGCNQ